MFAAQCAACRMKQRFVAVIVASGLGLGLMVFTSVSSIYSCIICCARLNFVFVKSFCMYICIYLLHIIIVASFL